MSLKLRTNLITGLLIPVLFYWKESLTYFCQTSYNFHYGNMSGLFLFNCIVNRHARTFYRDIVLRSNTDMCPGHLSIHLVKGNRTVLLSVIILVHITAKVHKLTGILSHFSILKIGNIVMVSRNIFNVHN